MLPLVPITSRGGENGLFGLSAVLSNSPITEITVPRGNFNIFGNVYQYCQRKSHLGIRISGIVVPSGVTANAINDFPRRCIWGLIVSSEISSSSMILVVNAFTVLGGMTNSGTIGDIPNVPICVSINGRT